MTTIASAMAGCAIGASPAIPAKTSMVKIFVRLLISFVPFSHKKSFPRNVALLRCYTCVVRGPITIYYISFHYRSELILS